MRRSVRALLAGLLIVAGCSVAAPTATPGRSSPPASTPGPQSSGPESAAASRPPSVPLTIFGAASLKPVLDEARVAWEAGAPGSRLTISTDSSATLAAQIELGAPADVLLSADTANPRRLADKRLVAGQVVPFATNRLTIIVPAGNPAGVRAATDLARPGLRIIAAGAPVPITGYATQVVDRIAAEPGAPAGFAAAYAANIRSREDNVRAVVAKIELGEGDAAIVYLTDARGTSKVATVELPDRVNVPASYAGVVIRASQHVAAAEAFLDWFAGPAGQAILTRYGFLPPG